MKKRITNVEKEKLWKFGEKGIVFEPFQTRVYPHADLYSHIIGQTDYDNYGISGVENFYDKYLRNRKNLKKPLKLSLDTNIQYIVKNELDKAVNLFDATGAASIVMDADNGEVLSLVSLPDFNINKRDDVRDKIYMNKITKGVFELGSIFKTFTIALALDEKIVTPNTKIKNIKNNINCSIHKISDIKKFPETMTVEEILIQSSNIGTVKIARKIGKEKYKKFLKELNLLNSPKFELDEIGSPIPFNWNKCKLETISFGHGITTTPLQAATAYASLINGGKLIIPTLEKNKNNDITFNRIISEKTSSELKKILRKVVTDEKGTASLADVFGYKVSGKTGTSQYYDDKNKNINTFVSFFNVSSKNYILLVMLDNPQVATNLTYNYRGLKIKGTRNEAGWNAVYSAGKIIEKIGPILAINNKEIPIQHVVKKLIKNCPKKLSNITVTGLSSDTRKLKKGNLFFALRGSHYNGEKYIKEALRMGACAVISSGSKSKSLKIIKVQNIRDYLGKICSKFYKNKPKNIIAVTGTNGKSSVVDFFHQIFSLNNIPVATIGTLGIKTQRKKKAILRVLT